MIRARDQFRCVRCGQPGAHVHHRILGNRSDMRPSNLILLCEPCHRRVHKNSRQARLDGYIVSRHLPRNATLAVPVLYAQPQAAPPRLGWYSIDDEFGLREDADANARARESRNL